MSLRIMTDGAPDRELAERGLPEMAYRFEAEVGIVVIRRGVPGYFSASNVPDGLTSEQSGQWVVCQNTKMGVTQAQADAMFVGSAFGWHVPLADPIVAASVGDKG